MYAGTQASVARASAHRDRSANWTSEQTKELIALRREADESFNGHKTRRDTLWSEIAQRLARGSFSPNALQVKNRWENLIKDVKVRYRPACARVCAYGAHVVCAAHILL